MEGGGQEAELVHGAAQVVVRLLAAAPQVEVRVEKGAGLQKTHNTNMSPRTCYVGPCSNNGTMVGG